MKIISSKKITENRIFSVSEEHAVDPAVLKFIAPSCIIEGRR